MNFSRLVIFLTYWNFTDAEKKPALFYDLTDEKLVEIRNFDDIKSYMYCLSACPVASNSSKEKLLNDEISIKNKSLFLRYVYHNGNLRHVYQDHEGNLRHVDLEGNPQKGIVANEMEIEICENSYTHTWGWNYSSEKFEVGYELYYEGRYKSYLRTWTQYLSFFNSDSINKGNEFLDDQDPMDTDTAEASAGNLVKMSHDVLNTEFEIIGEPGQKWLFYWISVLSITVSNDRKHRCIKFNPDETNDLFKTSNDPEPELGKESKEFSDYLVEIQIIPMRMFHTTAARRATHVFLNSTFIWKTIANEILIEIDLFVYKIYRKWLERLEIYFGAYGDLKELNQVAEEQLSSKHYTINRSTVPKSILFRLITKPRIYTMDYGVIIVIHNELEPVKDIDRICSTKDDIEGSDSIATEFSYTCPYTKEVLLKLGFDEKSSLFKDMRPLKLNELLERNDEASSSR